jgi:uncharacterized protein (DUF427 family)
MPTASWNGVVLAQSDRCESVEGNVYFPPETINKKYFVASATHTMCSWKGTASYYDVVVEGKSNQDAAWFYPDPKPAAGSIKGYIAFWHGVKVDP